MLFLHQKCFSTLFLKFHWGDEKCRGILYSKIIVLLEKIQFFQPFPQLFLIFKNKSIDGICMLSMFLNICYNEVYLSLCFLKHYFNEIFFDSLLDIAISLIIIFFWAYIDKRGSAFRRYFWKFSAALTIFYCFCESKKLFPRLIDYSSFGWFIRFVVPTLSPMFQSFKMICKLEKGNLSILGITISLIGSIRKVIRSYKYEKSIYPFIETITSFTFNFLSFILVLVLPRKRSCCAPKPEKID